MKRFLMLSLFIIAQMLFFNSIFAQQQNGPVLEPEDTTFQAIYDKMVAYFETQNPSGSFDEGSDENQFYRWAHFWRPRVDNNGGFKGASKAMAEFINNGFNLCDSEEDGHIYWKNLGPFNSDGASRQNQGRIDAISVHPQDPNIILAGGINGGIWKTINAEETNGGVEWYNTTDDDGFSITGASRIIRHPRNPDIVYAATYSAFGAWNFGHGFGLGIIKSVDGGETWAITGYSPAY